MTHRIMFYLVHISTTACADHLSHVTLDFGTGLLYTDTAVLF